MWVETVKSVQINYIVANNKYHCWWNYIVILPQTQSNLIYSILEKAKRLKQAKEEAQAEIEAYRKEREDQFKKYEQQVWYM